MLAEPQLLVALVLAHLLADFYFQPFTWVQQRNERHALALPLYLHAIIHGVLAASAMFLFSSTISIASIGIGAIVVAVSHFKIDVIKSYCKQNTTSFVVDQIAHIVVILGVFLYATNQWREAVARGSGNTSAGRYIASISGLSLFGGTQAQFSYY